jgi:hypothetical protein
MIQKLYSQDNRRHASASRNTVQGRVIKGQRLTKTATLLVAAGLSVPAFILLTLIERMWM